MPLQLAGCYCLLLLGATATLAQTHPRKKPVRKPVVVQKEWPTRMRDEEDAFIQHTYELLDTARSTQPAPLGANRVYTYVEQMPALNGQTGLPVIIAAINQHLVVPPAPPAGRVVVRFEVNKQGYVSYPEIARGLRADLDSAVVAATRQLPRFMPGKQGGQVVRVSFTLPVTFPMKQP